MNIYTKRWLDTRRALLALSINFALIFVYSPAIAKQLPQLLIILDSSISMEDQLAGELKYKLVRRAMSKALPAFAGKLKTGLVTFGRAQENSCKDIARVVPLKILKPKPFSLVLKNFKPKGKSPIGASLADAATMAEIATNPLHMLLIADGGDNCRADVCATADLIARHSPQTKIHVIGLGKSGTVKKLACVSKATNGIFALAGNKGEMTKALSRVLQATLKNETTAPANPAEKTVSALEMPPLPARRPARKITKQEKKTSDTPPAPAIEAKKPEPTPAPEPIPEPTPAKKVAPVVPERLITEEKTPDQPTKVSKKPEPPVQLEIVEMPVPAPEVTPLAPMVLQVTPAPTPVEPEQAEEAPAPKPTIPATTFLGDRPSIEITLPQTSAPVKLSALVTEEGKAIENGLVWRIYNTKRDGSGRYKLVKTAKTAQFNDSLPLGVYLVNLSWGRSHLTQKMDILSSKPFTRNFVVNAGGLRLSARHMDGTVPPSHQIVYKIYSDERDQFGKRRLVLNNARPDKTIRLNAGIYHITSLYGTANGLIETDITVEAGKLTDAVINHQASKVTFKLVNQPGGEALAGAIWRIQTPDGKLVKEAGGALPTLILAAGDYTINAKYSGRTFARTVSIDPGAPVHVEIVIQ